MDIKPQDIVFVLVLGFLIYKRVPKLLIGAGLISLIISIPLFAKWIFFTAERLTWYSMAFFLVAVILLLTSNLRKDSESND